VGRLGRPPRESADGRRAPRRHRLGGQSEVVLPEILGDGDHGLELNVIPGHREAMNPESPDDARDSGFALRAQE